MPVLQEQKPVIGMDGMYAGFAGAKTGHGRMTLNRGFLVLAIRSFGLAAFAPICRRHPCSVLAVGCEYAVKPNQIDSRLGDQGSQLGDEVYRL